MIGSKGTNSSSGKNTEKGSKVKPAPSYDDCKVDPCDVVRDTGADPAKQPASPVQDDCKVDPFDDCKVDCDVVCDTGANLGKQPVSPVNEKGSRLKPLQRQRPDLSCFPSLSYYNEYAASSAKDDCKVDTSDFGLAVLTKFFTGAGGMKGVCHVRLPMTKAAAIASARSGRCRYGLTEEDIENISETGYGYYCDDHFAGSVKVKVSAHESEILEDAAA